MKKTAISAAALLLSTTPIFAAGIERSTQSINILFEEGNYGLCCTNRVRDSSRESSVLVANHEQTDTPRLQDPQLAGL